MNCCTGKTKGNGTVSKVLMTILNVILIIWSLYFISMCAIAELNWTLRNYGISLIPEIIFYSVLVIICSIGTSVSCCSNIKVLKNYTVLFGLFIIFHVGYFIYGIIISYKSQNILNQIILNTIVHALEIASVVLAILVLKNLDEIKKGCPQQVQYHNYQKMKLNK